MSKTLVTILALSMATLAPVAVADDETDAECEQPYWIGYTTTQTARATYHSLRDPSDPLVNTCEGEHWDGQDQVAASHNPGSGEGCLPSLSGTSLAWCMDNDPNAGNAAPTGDNGMPVVFRVSGTASTTGAQVYVATDIAYVGRAVLYNGACTGGAGLEKDTACGGRASTRTATYLRDNTDQATSGTNVLATIVSAAGLTKGHPSEADCNQATYQQGAIENRRDLCGRDNTAITVETLLP